MPFNYQLGGSEKGAMAIKWRAKCWKLTWFLIKASTDFFRSFDCHLNLFKRQVSIKWQIIVCWPRSDDPDYCNALDTQHVYLVGCWRRCVRARLWWCRWARWAPKGGPFRGRLQVLPVGDKRLTGSNRRAYTLSFRANVSASPRQEATASQPPRMLSSLNLPGRRVTPVAIVAAQSTDYELVYEF